MWGTYWQMAPQQPRGPALRVYPASLRRTHTARPQGGAAAL